MLIEIIGGVCLKSVFIFSLGLNFGCLLIVLFFLKNGLQIKFMINIKKDAIFIN
jgi:hypothetical protein